MGESWPEIVDAYNASRPVADRGAICHAPSVSLNFDQSGNATACCYNRKYVLGSYPRRTLKEIWEGDEASRLREAVKAGDLSQGCEQCHKQLEARNFSGVRARFFDRKFAPRLKRRLMPRIMEFELSNACNLECVMCTGFFSSSIRRNRECLEPMLQPYDDAFVEQLKPFLRYLKTARFLGGEPLLIPIYLKIWEAILKHNPKIDVVVTTNATTLGEKAKKLLWSLKPRIVVSCDSLDKKTYESIRIGADFDQVRSHIDEFLKLSRRSRKAMAITVCPMTLNWRTIPDLLRFCNEKGACIGFNTVEWPSSLSIRSLPQGEIRRIVGYLETERSPELAWSPDWWVRHNFGVYEGMLNQLKTWGHA